MARVLVITDLPSDDQAWKGPIAWQIILALAQSQHDVKVVTTRSNLNIPTTHPNVSVIQPIKSWRIDQLPRLAQVILSFKPEAIQTFALSPSTRWPALSVWPALNQLCSMSPKLQRISTLFDELDYRANDPSVVWHQQANTITTFSTLHGARLSPLLKRTVQVLPLDPSLLQLTCGVKQATSSPRRVLIPAPISEWRFPEVGLEMLSAFCERHPKCEVYILGGWGDWSTKAKKCGWRTLESVLSRVHIVESSQWSQLIQEVYECDSLWLEPLAQDSWRYLIAVLLGEQQAKRLYLPSDWTPSLATGSTANVLSRLYANYAVPQ